MIWKIKYEICNDPILIDMEPNILVLAPTIETALKASKYDNKYIISIEKIGYIEIK